MKIAIIEPVGGHGGMNYYDYGLALGLYQNAIDVTYFTCDKTRVEFEDEITTYKTYQKIWGNKNKLIRLFNYLRSSCKTLRKVKRMKIDIVHFHYFDFRILEVWDLILCKCMKRKVVVTIHDIETFQGNSKRTFNLGKYASRIQKFIVHNESSRSALIATFQIDPSKIVVIPHGNFELFIDASNIKNIEFPNLKEDDFTVLFFGQIKDVKGLDILINSIALCKARIPNIKLLIAGKCWQSDFSSYQNLIDELDLNESVLSRIEYIPDDEVAAYYNRTDLVVLPYKRIYQSGVLLMTLNYGKPVLVSDLEAMTEIINDGQNGFVFKSEDPESLSDKIIYIHEHPEIAIAVAKQGFNDITKKHNWKEIGLKTKAIYTQL